MHEYALMLMGEVVTIVMTSRPHTDLVALHIGYEVVPLDQVPIDALRRYPYWSERP